jgi:hypothetical protein
MKLGVSLPALQLPAYFSFDYMPAGHGKCLRPEAFRADAKPPFILQLITIKSHAALSAAWL